MQLIVPHQAELAATSAFVDGPSDGRGPHKAQFRRQGTSQGTAASVAVLAQQSPSPPFVILSRAVLPKDIYHYHLTMDSSKVQGVCVCVCVYVIESEFCATPPLRPVPHPIGRHRRAAGFHGGRGQLAESSGGGQWSSRTAVRPNFCYFCHCYLDLPFYLTPVCSNSGV